MVMISNIFNINSIVECYIQPHDFQKIIMNLVLNWIWGLP